MRLSAACLVIFGLTGSAIASDVQRGDAVVTLADGIGCYDRGAYENVRGHDVRSFQKGEFPKGCLVVHAPAILIVETVNSESNALCARVPDLSFPKCFWFSIENVRAMLRVDQRRTEIENLRPARAASPVDRWNT
jgi:hypothetical protein